MRTADMGGDVVKVEALVKVEPSEESSLGEVRGQSKSRKVTGNKYPSFCPHASGSIAALPGAAPI